MQFNWHVFIPGYQNVCTYFLLINSCNINMLYIYIGFLYILRYFQHTCYEPARIDQLNYHTGIVACTLAQLVLAYHTSVQCFNTDYADVITAVRLNAASMDEHLDLAKIELDNEAATKMSCTISFL